MGAHLPPAVNDTCEITVSLPAARQPPGEGSLTRTYRPRPQHLPKIIPTASRKVIAARKPHWRACVEKRKEESDEERETILLALHGYRESRNHRLPAAGRAASPRGSADTRDVGTRSKNIACGSLNSFLSSFHVSRCSGEVNRIYFLRRR